MKTILFIVLFTFELFALNPKVYSVLGDQLYDNLENIGKLQDINEFKMYSKKIQEYYLDVKSVRKIGFMIDKGNSEASKTEYLKELRKLSKTNDFFIKSVNSVFQKSLKDEDSDLFLKMLNSGLLDSDKYKQEIKRYYYEHKDEIDIKGTVIERFVNEDIKNKKRVYTGPSKKELQKAKIERIRAKDKAKQEAIAKSIEEELLKKKKKIREEQKKELKTK
ncbi:hypothetical protein FJR48_01785 [Sulfurimonas lithotrophica]|uniref:Uncharacterized protein n=1 Tax=Sulfurimonas lithotrophica TaxID=2590022 RepID=A0A5P8NYL0_9BACT|nr:hypothetical protein [Sulfurimonas lithotrophica]QFR48523.1 hypothetical protein FJR48_01785 [Sulfurimonas lithotrophica]